jgi:predicted nicotinamide N-methyase
MKPEAPASCRPMPETPLEAIDDIVTDKVIIEARTFTIKRPANGDTLLDHPAVRAAFAADEYMPYWTDLWPAARMLAKAILRGSWPPGTAALEVGCGLGLPGIAALARGLRVTFSDCDGTALKFAAANAQANGFADFKTLQLDWRHPPACLSAPLILASDLIYEIRNVEPLVNLIKLVLLPQGTCLLTDQDRIPSAQLKETLARENLKFTLQVMHAGEPGGRRVRGTLYRISHVS